jgi:beta-N-acetylhexosaminidase
MNAVSARYAVPDAAVAAIRAGCDALLICSGNVDVQAQALEALVKAVETGEIPLTRLDEAERRLRRAKTRFLAARPSSRARQRAWRDVVGCEAHRRVADEMAAFL